MHTHSCDRLCYSIYRDLHTRLISLAQVHGSGVALRSIEICCRLDSGITESLSGVDARLPNDEDGQSLTRSLLNRITKSRFLFTFEETLNVLPWARSWPRVELQCSGTIA